MRIRRLINSATIKTTVHIRQLNNGSELFTGKAKDIPKDLMSKVVYQYHPASNILVIDVGDYYEKTR